MRGRQLKDIAKQNLPKKYNIKYSSLDMQYSNDLLYLTKGAILSSTVSSLEALKSRNNTLIFDPVDSRVPTDKIKYADVLVAASRTAFKDFKKNSSLKIVLIDHHVDPRIKAINFTNPPNKFKAAYFGEIVNTQAFPELKNFVDFIQVDTYRQNNSWLKHLPNYNFHYAIRKKNTNDGHKPFLKGFTAAYCNSNILIQNSDKEALAWLGNDYPFLLKGEVSNDEIFSAIEFAQSCFNTETWKQGLYIMERIKKEVSDENIGIQLRHLFESL
jgi:hypothetical protein